MSLPATHDRDPDRARFARRHLRWGWWSLLLFLTLGITLEALHGFKVRWYLDVSNETRRLMWTLAHAHGVLLALVNVAYGLTLRAGVGRAAGRRRLASACLVSAALLLPGGFFLGGLVIYEADPGLGILLVPVGAVALFVGVLLVALDTARGGPASGGDAGS